MTPGIRRLTYLTFGTYDHAEAKNDEERFLQSASDLLCPFRKTGYRRFTHLLSPPSPEALQRVKATGGPYSQQWSLDLLLCPACGWWHLSRHNMMIGFEIGPTNLAMWYRLYHAVYSEIALDSPALPIDQLRKHLQRFWQDRKFITAQQAEDLVASVLREHYDGEVLRLTANANAPDGGIDLLIVSDGGLIRRAIQVKRRISHDVEPIEDVRNFIGAMLLSGNENGVFVTTATRFSRGAANISTNANLTRRRLSVELIDGDARY
jgi:restriction system protein